MVAPQAARTPVAELSARLVDTLRGSEIHVPPYPAVAHAIARLEPGGRASVREVAELVATDSALAATVLRHAAAAAHAAQGSSAGTPLTLEAAIWKLGLEELIRVVIATSVGATAWAPGPLASLRRDQWRRSLLAALFAKELAQRRGVVAEQAFLAGLLHDFGAVVVLACLERLGALPVLPEPTWRALVADLHVEFGMVVAARWQLPEPITEAIASHHTPQSCMRLHRPLVQLIAVVDHVLELLERGPSEAAALADVPGLEPDERLRIVALLPRVAEHMARFELPAPRSERSAVAPAPALVDGGWPVDFAVEGKNHVAYRACALAPGVLAFRGPVALAPAWLAELTLHCPPDSLTLLAHVKTCEPLDGGEFLLTAQPFGLAGEDKGVWLRLLGRTQRAAS